MTRNGFDQTHGSGLSVGQQGLAAVDTSTQQLTSKPCLMSVGQQGLAAVDTPVLGHKDRKFAGSVGQQGLAAVDTSLAHL